MKKENNEYVGFIYKATCKLNNKCYIGETSRSFEKRKIEHINASKNLKHKSRNCHFYRALRKYGENNFEWEIVEICKSSDKNSLYDDLFKLEIQYIEKYNTFNNGYNSDLGGIGSKGRVTSEETRTKLRLINLGRKMSSETKERLREQRIGKNISEEHRLKIKENTKKACENNPERSKKIKEGLQLGVNVFTEDGILINNFPCIKDGSKFYNVDPSYVTKNCKRIAMTCGKLGNLRLIWRYINDSFSLEDRINLKPVIVDVFDFENNFIKTFDCSKDVCIYYGVQSSSVSSVLTGKQNYCKLKDGSKIAIKYKNFN